MNDRLAMIAKQLVGDNPEAHSKLILSAMAGAMVLSRSVVDRALTEKLRTETRDLLLRTPDPCEEKNA